MRRLRRLLLLVVLASAAAKLVRLLRQYRPQLRVDVYFDDGSLATLAEDDPSGAELVLLARDVRSAAA